MRTITIKPSKDSGLIAQALSLYDAFRNAQPNEQLNFDLNQLQWACPILVLPISAYIQNTKSTYTIAPEHQLDPYLKAIRFPLGVDQVSTFAGMEKQPKSYVPISLLRRSSGDREKLETEFVKMIYKILAPTEGARDAIYYPIIELVANVFEHSKKDEGFVFGQYYPNKQYVDICIVDCGRGLSKSYEEELKMQLTDKQAISQAMEGRSTKPDKDRGYGVRTSKRVVAEALGGGFVYISGNAGLLVEKDKTYLTELPEFYWQGAIVAFRIPKPTQAVDIYPYLE